MPPSLATSSLGCPDEESLYRYASGGGKLGEPRSGEVAAHLAVCPMCRAALTSLDGSKHARDEEDTLGDGEERTIVDGRYRVREVLGRGASATVYRAEDTRLGEEVALKIFRAGLGEKVAQEVLIARRVSHPNVCRVYDAGVSEGVTYLSMELVRGDTLSARMAARAGEPDPEADAIVRAILAGLGAAHDAGVIHRDLKPQNILVEPSGRVVITDFGLARLADEEESRARIIGTPATWSPEQARGEPATTASDVYSFGVVAYRLLTGRAFRVSDAAPFEGVAKPWRAMLERALALSPRDRAANAAEVRALLSQSASPPWRGVVAVVLAGAVIALGAYFALHATPNVTKEPPLASTQSAPVVAPTEPGSAVVVASPSPSPSSPVSAAASASPPETKPEAKPGVHAAAHPSHSAKAPPVASHAGPPTPQGPDLLFGK